MFKINTEINPYALYDWRILMARKTYVSMTEMAKRYGYTLNAIKSWRAEGLPYSDNPAGIPEDEGTLWIVQNKINPMRNMSVKDEFEKEKLREQIAKADLATYTAKEKSGELISVDYVQSELNRFCSQLKDKLRLMPKQHALEILASAVSVEELRDCLKEKIDQTLRELDTLFDDPDLQEHSEDVQTEQADEEQEIDLN
ncbi:TPA: hypothetical protein JF854_001501 [Enterobacter hormaechei subsp. steigerwaltii]|uniref:hypothetical protein n=1 Tax=Enterobacter hormaechei TaxID=158836 RepID=UPI0005F2750D|nr:hypothetical protein [Enterobacter hormaechei]HAS0712530.1 hypothetical protein [Enterobacter hormaechei subsp. steigerwaltii]KJL72582.1 hypothetical protein SS38_05730 [Enterobacter hormaechei subsp. xiangfangensis]HAS0890278.1 hypothetical protein [Enterobacter hormaechei subsp. steigerwaltii]HAS0898913.1 hypothetical protein [Enterobacter hormaechei subsp. steigerwaltii]HAT7679704.1 hypothetical protein [Enterobacter hormaechei subsp. steigerwaltii]